MSTRIQSADGVWLSMNVAFTLSNRSYNVDGLCVVLGPKLLLICLQRLYKNEGMSNVICNI